jgi:ribosomal subunit interface protein
MNRKITFHNMESSEPMEKIANERLDKIEDFLKGYEWVTPFNIELWLRANPQHPHHAAELNLKTPRFDLNAHAKGTKMYMVIDEVVDKMIALLKKEKEKLKDKEQKTETEKKEFSDDKYNL